MKHGRAQTNSFDVIVVGGGHAGIEAAVVSARLGCQTVLVSQDLRSIGRLSCNPSIGGSAKGHLVKELDALGGVMPYIADRSGLLFKMLNTSKGPAVWSPRSQNDKDLYPGFAQQLLLRVPGLSFCFDIVEELEVDGRKVRGIVTRKRERLQAQCVVLCTGTFLNGVLHTGTAQVPGGRIGELPSGKVGDVLDVLGVQRGRLKTG
ncbi:MAG: FAD-dependent oxidoreductase, partial [Candidatus Kapaibacterium sp.]